MRQPTKVASLFFMEFRHAVCRMDQIGVCKKIEHVYGENLPFYAEMHIKSHASVYDLSVIIRLPYSIYTVISVAYTKD